MTIFGALLSIVGSLEYATVDELRANYKSANYQIAKKPEIDDELYRNLINLFDDNWDNYGASLYPKKMIPFLALHDRIRRLWVIEIVKKIMAAQGKEPDAFNSELAFEGDASIPYGCGVSSYTGTAKSWSDKSTIYGPSYFEYDFVKKKYPDDWSVYCNAEDEKNERVIMERRKKSANDIMLVIIGVALVSLVCILFFVFPQLFLSLDTRSLRLLIISSVCIAVIPFVIVLNRHSKAATIWIAYAVIAIMILLFLPDHCW